MMNMNNWYWFKLDTTKVGWQYVDIASLGFYHLASKHKVETSNHKFRWVSISVNDISLCKKRGDCLISDYKGKVIYKKCEPFLSEALETCWDWDMYLSEPFAVKLNSFLRGQGFRSFDSYYPKEWLINCKKDVFKS